MNSLGHDGGGTIDTAFGKEPLQGTPCKEDGTDRQVAMEQREMIRIDQQHLVPVVRVAGEVDLAVAPELEADIDAALASDAGSVVVDLAAATFLDSMALSVLAAARKKCQTAGGDLYLIVDEPRILKVFEITGLKSEFQIFADRSELELQANGSSA
jgi:anti-sigma B factor antagonist